MDDDFLTQFREEPRPEFSRSLRTRLSRVERDRRPSLFEALRLPAVRWSHAVAGLAAIALGASLLATPTGRAAAQSFLDLFRVKKFAAVPIDPNRLETLSRGELDLRALLSDSIEVVRDPGSPQPVASLEEASSMAGIPVRLPAVLPVDASPEPEIRVLGEGRARLTADTSKLSALLEGLEIRDVEIPANLDGATVDVTLPPRVMMRYTRGEDSFLLMQARSPEIALPEGVDLARLGEIGLRIAGLGPNEAREFARSVDWNGTLLVPIPADAASFREVTVWGAPALMISTENAPEKRDAPPRHGKILLWSDGGIVYALTGPGRGVDIIEMANSIR